MPPNKTWGRRMFVCLLCDIYLRDNETLPRRWGRPAPLFPYGFCLQNACSSLSPSPRRCADGEARSILVLFSDRVAASRFASSPMHGRLNRAPRLGPRGSGPHLPCAQRGPRLRDSPRAVHRLSLHPSFAKPRKIIENNEPRLLRRL